MLFLSFYFYQSFIIIPDYGIVKGDSHVYMSNKVLEKSVFFCGIV